MPAGPCDHACEISFANSISILILNFARACAFDDCLVPNRTLLFFVHVEGICTRWLCRVPLHGVWNQKPAAVSRSRFVHVHWFESLAAAAAMPAEAAAMSTERGNMRAMAAV